MVVDRRGVAYSAAQADRLFLDDSTKARPFVIRILRFWHSQSSCFAPFACLGRAMSSPFGSLR
jgi:hypothetical protein